MTRTTTPVTAFLLALALAAATPALAAQGSRPARGHWGETQALRIQLGEFTPDGDSVYWDEKAVDFTGSPEDFEDVALSIDYLRLLSGRLGLLVSGSFFEGANRPSYRDFVDEFGGEIVHDTELEISSFTVGLLAHLTRRDRAVVPYVGAGGGLWVYRLSERGDFIDFTPFSGPEIFFGDFETEGEAFGYYLQAGLEVPVGHTLSVYADARWSRVDDDLDDDFQGFGELDLGGRAIAFGVAWSF